MTQVNKPAQELRYEITTLADNTIIYSFHLLAA